MSDEVLNQNQVESLLRAMEAGGELPEESEAADSEEAAGQRRTAESRGATEQGTRHGVVPYDFKRPERVGKDQMRAMHALHETLARGFGASFSTMMRTIVDVKLVSVDQLTYSEFVFSLDNPSCFHVLGVEPLEGSWTLDISPALSYAIIDRMLGGDPHPGEMVSRALTEIEARLISRLVRMFLEHLAHAWENIVKLDLTIERFETNPQLVQIVPPNEVVILVGLEVMLGRNRGMINLGIPFNTIERFNSQLSNNGWVGYNKSRYTEKTRQTIAENVDAAAVELVVTLARSKIRTNDLLGLSVGDVVTTEKDVEAPLEVAIQQIPKFCARPGAFKGKKAIRIEAALPEAQQRMTRSAQSAESVATAAALAASDPAAPSDPPAVSDPAAAPTEEVRS